MKYLFSPELQEKAEDISKSIFPHIKIEHIKCFRSQGSKSRGTIARCHALGKVMQKALGREAFYVLEFISERFDKLPEEEKTKTIIHELMHVPKSFGGGFKHHDFVNHRNIKNMYEQYLKLKEQSLQSSFTDEGKI